MTRCIQVFFNLTLLVPMLMGAPVLFIYCVKAAREGELMGLLFAVLAVLALGASLFAVANSWQEILIL